MADATYPLYRPRRRRFRIRIGNRPRLIAICALCLALVAGTIALLHRRPAPDPAGSLANAKQTLAAGNYSAARNNALTASSSTPQRAVAEAVLARACLELGDGGAAEAALIRARDAGMSADRLHHLQAHARLLQGDPDGALAEAAKATSPDADHAMRVRALALAAKGNVFGAQTLLQGVLEQAPRDTAAWTTLGRIRFDAGDIAGAADAATHAATLAPWEPAALVLEGEVVRSRYGLAAALPWFDAALKRDAYYPPALIDQAATFGDLGRNTDMLASARALMAARPGDRYALYFEAVLAARAGRLDLSRSLLSLTGDRVDFLPGAILLGGAIDYAQGKDEQAIGKWRRLQQMQPLNIGIRRLLASALLRSGDAAGAREMLRPIVLRGDADAYSLRLAARAFEAGGDRAAAALYLDRASAGGSGAAPIFASADEIGTLQAGAAQAPSDPTYAIGIMRGLIDRGDTAGAIANARSLVAAAPGAPAAQLALGDALVAAGRYADAVASYARAADLSFDEPTMLRLVDADGRDGHVGNAAATLALYLAQNPQSVTARRLLGHLQVVGGQFDAAIETLESVRGTVGQRDVALLADLAVAYAGAGDGDVARRYAAAAYALAPMSAGVADAYAVALVAAGDTDGARQLIAKATALAPKDPAIAAHRRQIGG
ncbi:tetratricopeptide repeat protein [uncultured Sphingomonas sp.]|uniref:tetratricopeptide repeat protein n=1 Tax=uncultured Sphingomonas sp. TaxID=158754 RepID=UPI0035CA187A